MKVAQSAALRLMARRIRDAFVPRVVVLLYHRVAELPLDPQLLCVSPKHFAEHLAVLRGYGRPIQLRGLSQLLASGISSQRGVVVTFDDGYADNLHQAKPLLARYDIPATVFVAAGYVGAEREFWYDALERLLLHHEPLPEILRLRIDGQTYEWKLGTTSGAENNGQLARWNVSLEDNPTPRHEIYRTLCETVGALPDEQRRHVLDELSAWANIDLEQRPSHRTLSAQELIDLADGGLVEIGAHTVSHPLLSALPENTQTEEIYRSKARLQEIVGQPVTTFAYPFGRRSDYTEHSVAMVRQAGFDFACSNFAGLVRPRSDRWQLPRFLVRDWDGEEFARNLEAWTNG